MDAMDVAGENQIDIEHDMTKQRLDPGGMAIGDPFSEIVSFPVGKVVSELRARPLLVCHQSPRERLCLLR